MIDFGIRHFRNESASLLSEIVIQSLSLEADEFWFLLKLGAIYVNDERQAKNKNVPAASAIRVHLEARRYNCNYQWSSLIIFENDFCLVLNKPSGVPSHPTVDNFIENSLTQTSLARKYPLFVTHRLDTLTSGLIVYAKKQAFAKSFNQQLQARSIRKKYVALVESAETFPPRLNHFMDPAARTPKKLSDSPVDGWPVCELEILEQKRVSSELSWVKINLLTGRTHQIRAQMAHLQAPVLGDLLYGSKKSFQNNAIALRSCEIEFDCGDERLKFNVSEEFNI